MWCSGIFLGFAVVWIVDHNWRIVLGSAAIPAIILLFLVFACPESPRFLIRTNNYRKAYESLRHLRGSDIQAARDLYYIHSQLQTETELLLDTPPGNWYSQEAYQEVLKNMGFFQRVKALWTKPRNRRACLTAFLVMAAQQFCGVSISCLKSSSTNGYRLMWYLSTRLCSLASCPRVVMKTPVPRECPLSQQKIPKRLG